MEDSGHRLSFTLTKRLVILSLCCLGFWKDDGEWPIREKEWSADGKGKDGHKDPVSALKISSLLHWTALIKWKLLTRSHLYGYNYNLRARSLSFQAASIVLPSGLWRLICDTWCLKERFDSPWLCLTLTNSSESRSSGFPPSTLSPEVPCFSFAMGKRRSVSSTAGGDFALNSETVEQTEDFTLRPRQWPTELQWLTWCVHNLLPMKLPAVWTSWGSSLSCFLEGSPDDMSLVPLFCTASVS